eukprot:2685574-Rhodomonas_salina.1
MPRESVLAHVLRRRTPLEKLWPRRRTTFIDTTYACVAATSYAQHACASVRVGCLLLDAPSSGALALRVPAGASPTGASPSPPLYPRAPRQYPSPLEHLSLRQYCISLAPYAMTVPQPASTIRFGSTGHAVART